MKAYRLLTKKQIEKNGFVFLNLPNGFIGATNNRICLRALTLKTLRKEISFYLS